MEKNAKQKSNKGITIVALVITIIILLILAGITIASLTGENGIINASKETKDETDKSDIESIVHLEALQTYTSKGGFDSEKFKQNVYNHLAKYNPTINENDESIIVTIDGYDVVIDIDNGEIIDAPQTSTGVYPKVETTLYQTDGKQIEEGDIYNEVVLTAKVINKYDLDTYDITFTDSKENVLEKNKTVTGDGDASTTIYRNGLYTVIVKGTKNGQEKTVKKTVVVNCTDPEVPTVTINPNGGNVYVMPTTGTAKISTTITSSNPNKKGIAYHYAWNTSNVTEPSEWEKTTSAATLTKTDCTEGNYYLWVRVSDEMGVMETRFTTSEAFVINSNTSENSKITLTPSTTKPTNQNVIVTATYGKNLTQNKTLTCTGTENVDYIKNGITSITVITNGQTVTASATDIMGNKVVETYKVNNIDKVPPTTIAPSATSTTNSITVSFAQTDSDSGINSSTRQYAIKKTTDSTWSSWVTDSNTTHTFTGLTLDTNYDVKTQVKDVAGNGYTESKVTTIKTVNITKPTITLSTTAITNKNITATIKYPEIEGVTKQYSYDGSKWNTYTGPLTIEGNRTIYARSIDNSGQGADITRVASLTVTNIDKTAPIINSALAPTEWTNTNKTITITATDGDGSGIVGYAITTTNKAPTSWILTTATTWTSTTTYGNGTYYAWAKDVAGNISNSKEVIVNNIETTMPTISVSSNTTAAKSQTGTITIGDSDSGLAAGTYIIKYTWTTSEATPAWAGITTIATITVDAGAKTATTTVTKNDGTGTYYLHVQGQAIKDQSGNTISPTAYGTFKLDNTPPTVTFETNGSTTYKKSQSTKVTVSDIGGSTVNNSSLKYQWNQSTTPPAENTFSSAFTSGGTITKADGTGDNWYLWILAKDNLGNTAITKSNVFYLDNTNPTTTIPTATSTTNSITVSFTQTDSHSGINSSTKQYAIKKTSDSTWGSWVSDSNNSHTFTGLTLNTSYDVKTQVKDAAGNGYTESAVKTITTVNITKPTITLSKTDWTNQNITATITYPNISGITKQYSYDNSNWSTYTSALTIDSNKTIYARSIDSTNQGSDTTRIATLTVTNIDKTPPTMNSITSGNTGSTNGSIKITGKATDTLSGIVAYQFSTSDSLTASSGGWTLITRTTAQVSYDYTVPGNGTYYFYVKDAAGNINKNTIVIGNIDKIPPTISSASALISWSNTNKRITVTASDTGGSGIAGYAITTTNTAPSLWTASTEATWTSATAYGNGTYYAWVKDNAGNISNSKEVIVSNIETTAPTISVNNNSTAAKSQTGTITIQDSNSGFTEGTYNVKYTWTTSTTEPTWTDISTTTTITVSAGAKTGTTTVSKGDGTGTYYLHVQGQTLKDQAGNTSSPTAYGTFKIDNTGPEVTFGTNGNATYKKSQSTTVTISDIGGSTVNSNSLKYQWKQSTSQPSEGSFSTTFTNGGTITKSDGTANNWYLWILAKDSLGNTTITKSNVFYLDNTVPSTTVPTATSTTNSITVSFTQTDSHSGINGSTRQYAIKKTSDSTWGSWVTDSNTTHTFTGLTLNTSYDVKTQVKDAAGNGYTESAVKTITTVNITKPTITPSTTAATNQNITVTITYPNVSGTTKQYSYDNSTWNTYTSALTIDSNKTIYARSIDSTNQGSDSTRVASLTITNIDKTAPTVTLSQNGGSYTMPTSGNATIKTKLTASDQGTSGLNTLQYAWSTSNSQEPSSWLNFTNGSEVSKTDCTAGTYYLWTNVTDKAGNRATSVKTSSAFTVSKLSNPMTVTNKTIYVGATLDLSTTVSNAQGTLSYAIKNQTTSGSSISGSTLTAGTNSSSDDSDKTVVVTITAAGNGNYNSVNKDVTITVQKYTRTLSWDSTTPTSVTYGDTSKIAKAVASGSGGTAGGITYSSSATSYLTVNSSTGSLTAVAANGSSTITATLARTTTVKTTSITTSISVARANTATASSSGNKTYNGSSQTGATGSYVTWSGTRTATNAGTYTATATPDSNHTWSDGTTDGKSFTWTIYPKSVQTTSGNYSGNYDGYYHSITLNVNEPTSGYTIYYSTSTSLTGSNYTSGSTSKPSYSTGRTTVYWYVHTTNSNYSDVYGRNTITITAVPPTISLSSNGGSVSMVDGGYYCSICRAWYSSIRYHCSICGDSTSSSHYSCSICGGCQSYGHYHCDGDTGTTEDHPWFGPHSAKSSAGTCGDSWYCKGKMGRTSGSTPPSGTKCEWPGCSNLANGYYYYKCDNCFDPMGYRYACESHKDSYQTYRHNTWKSCTLRTKPRYSSISSSLTAESDYATISTKVTVTDQSGTGLSTLQYAWSTSSSTTPSSWSTLTNGQTVYKTTYYTGTWYLWVKATDNNGITTTIVSSAFRVTY